MQDVTDKLIILQDYQIKQETKSCTRPQVEVTENNENLPVDELGAVSSPYLPPYIMELTFPHFNSIIVTYH